MCIRDRIKVEVDITGTDYDTELEIRTYKKESSPNEKFEDDLKTWEEKRKEYEYLRLKKIFEPEQK